MTGVSALIVFLVAVVVAVALSTVMKFNIGIAGFIAAYFLGVVVMGYSGSTMAGFFPSSIILTQFIVTLFFGFALSTGVFKGVGDRIVYKFRNQPWAVPIVTAIAGFVVGSLGAGNEATPLVMSPLAFAFALEAGFNPLIAAVAVYFGSCGSGAFPWNSGVLLWGFPQESIGTEAGASTMWATIVITDIILAIMFFAAYFMLKGHKTRELPSMERPEPFNKTQKRVLMIVLIVICVLVVPNIINTFAKNDVCTWIIARFDVRVTCLLGTLVCIFLKLADVRDVVMNRVPWGLLVMLGGMCMLFNVGASMGVVDLAGEWIGSSVPVALVPAAIALIMGLLSFITNGITLWPLFCAMVPGIAAASGLDPIVLATCVMVGTMPTGFSPISTGGAMATIAADNDTREKLFWPQMGLALFGMVVNVALALVGFYPLVCGIFS